MASINTHTHSHGEIAHIDADTQAKTRMQGNEPHQRRAAGVCANANTPEHTLRSSYKPEITLGVHPNLPTPPSPPHTHTSFLQGGSWEIQWILICGHAEFLSPLQRGSRWGTPCGKLGGAGRAGKGHGTQVVEGTRGHMGPEGHAYPQSQFGLREYLTIRWLRQMQKINNKKQLFWGDIFRDMAKVFTGERQMSL